MTCAVRLPSLVSGVLLHLFAPLAWRLLLGFPPVDQLRGRRAGARRICRTAAIVSDSAQSR